MVAKLGFYVDGPLLANFQAVNALIAPRKLDQMLFLGDLNADPVIGANWASWQTTLGASMIVSTMAPHSTTLNAFAAGTYDTTGLYNNAGLAGLAAQCVSYGKPIILRLAHEFNGNWPPTYGEAHETAAQFVAGWKHVVDTFRAHGASNVLWCWCPNKWGLPFDNAIDPTVADGSGVNWYPGDSYVDIIGLDAYHDQEDETLYTPSDIILANYTTLRTDYPNKPFAIAEFGCSADSRLDTFCGGKAGWYALLFQLLHDHMSDTLFIQNWESEGGPSTPGDDWTIDSTGTDPAAKAAFVAGVTNPPMTAGTTGLFR